MHAIVMIDQLRCLATAPRRRAGSNQRSTLRQSLPECSLPERNPPDRNPIIRAAPRPPWRLRWAAWRAARYRKGRYANSGRRCRSWMAGR